MDKKAKDILFQTYWSGKGWKRDHITDPDDFLYAKDKGLMFDPLTIGHDDCVKRILEIAGTITTVYMLSGHSLYVLSSDMKLLSHHMIKGTLINYYKNAKGNLCLIAGSDYAEKASQLKAGSGIRIYEVVEKK